MAAELQIIFKGQDQVSSALSSVRQGLGDLGSAADGAKEKSGGFFSTIGSNLANIKAGADMIFGLGGAIAGAAADFVKGNAEFEQYGVSFQTLIKNSDDFKAKYAGVTDPLKLQAAAADEAKQRMQDLADFGASTPFELPEVVKADTIIQGFGLHSQASAEKFGFSGAQIRTIAGDVASGTGAKFEEMATLIGKFSAGATGEAISRMQELGITNRDELAKMGLEFSKSGQLLSPLPESMNVVLSLMKDKYGGLMDAQSQTFNGMMSNLSDWWAGTKRTIAEPIFDVLKDNLGGLLKLLGSDDVKNAVSGVATALAGGLSTAIQWLSTTAIPAMKDAWVTIAPLFQQASGAASQAGAIFQQVSGVIQSVISTITGVISTHADQIQTVLVNHWQTIQSSVTTVVNAVWSVISAVFGVVATFLQNNGASIMSTLITAWAAIQGAIDSVTRAVASIIDTVFGAIATFLNSHGAQIQALLTQAWETIKTLITAAVYVIQNIIVPTFQAIATFLAQHSAEIQQVLDGAWKIISGAIDVALSIIEGVIKTTMALIQGDWDGAWNAMSTMVGGVWDGVEKIISGTIETIKGILSGAWDAIKKTVESSWGDIKGAIQGAFDDVKKSFDGFVSDALQLGSDFVDGIIKGVKDAAGHLFDAVKNLIRDALGAGKDEAQSHSPSLLFAIELGIPIAQGIAEGIEMGSEEALKAMIDLIQSLIDVITSGVGAMNALRDFQAPMQVIMDSFAGSITYILERFRDLIKEFRSGTLTWMGDFMETIHDVLTTITDSVDAFNKLHELGGLALWEVDSFVNTFEMVFRALAGIAKRAEADMYWQLGTFAYNVGRAIEVIGPAVDALNKLRGFAGVAQENITFFGEALVNVLTQFRVAIGFFNDQWQVAIAAFGERVGKALSNLSQIIDGFAKLRDFEGVAFENIFAFGEALVNTLRMLQIAMGFFSTEIIAAVGTFGENTNKALASLAQTIDAIAKLKDFGAVPQSAIVAFGDALEITLREMVTVMQQFAASAVEAAGAFGENTGKAVGFISAAVDGLTKLVEFKTVPAAGITAFADSITRALMMIVTLAAQWTADALTSAQTFAESVQKVAQMIGSAVDALTKLSDTKFGSTMLDAFSKALSDFLSKLQTAVAPIAEDIGAQIVAGMTKGAVDAIPTFTQAILTGLQGALTAIRADLGIASPSSVFAERVGRPIGQGVAQGAASEGPNVSAAVSGLGGAALAGGQHVTNNYTYQLTYGSNTPSTGSAAQDLRLATLLTQGAAFVS